MIEIGKRCERCLFGLFITAVAITGLMTGHDGALMLSAFALLGGGVGFGVAKKGGDDQ